MTGQIELDVPECCMPIQALTQKMTMTRPENRC